MVLNPAIMPKMPYDAGQGFRADLDPRGVGERHHRAIRSVPAKNLKEFVAYAKANQDKLSYGSAGAGTMTHLAGELFKHLIGAPKIVHVPYKGAGPSLN